MSRVGVLLPAYNEEKNIRQVIREVKKCLANCHIVVVDDGSTDRTGELAKRMGVMVLRHPTNRGKGEALRTGFDYFLARPEISEIVIVDADRQYSASEADRLLAPLQRGEADFVMGYRLWAQVPFRHRLGNWVWRTCFNWFFDTRLRDTNCGFIALTRHAAKVVEDIYGGYIIENSLLVNALKEGLRILQVPVTVRYRQKRGLLSGTRMVLGILTFIFSHGIRYKLGKLKKFIFRRVD
jgi:glycosyltransferase involved in cell wall biosynthesis